jgi:hypothetical protein
MFVSTVNHKKAAYCGTQKRERGTKKMEKIIAIFVLLILFVTTVLPEVLK